MRQPDTSQYLRVLTMMCNYIDEYDRPPTIAEVAQSMGWKGRGWTVKVLEHLVAMQLVMRLDEGTSRAWWPLAYANGEKFCTRAELLREIDTLRDAARSLEN